MIALVTASIDPGLSAAAGALLIAVLNELRARARARTAQLERESARQETVRQVAAAVKGEETDAAPSHDG